MKILDRIWPWSVLRRAEAMAAAAGIARVQAEAAVEKAGNLWKEAHGDLQAVDDALAAADYRIRREGGESPESYRSRVAAILTEGRTAPVALAILDRLDAKTRAGFRDWLVAGPADAEVLRQRTSALADFRSELVAAFYATHPAERRAEAHRRGQEHNRIYLDAKMAQPAGRPA